MDDELIFNADDCIILTKNKIILEKQNADNSKEFKKKFKELDGCWELDLINDSNEDNDDWISINQDKLFSIFEDIKDRTVYTNLFDKLSFSDLCSYLNEHKKSSKKHDMEWSSYEEHKLFGIKYPSLQEWSAHNVIDLHYLFNVLHEYYNFSFGTPDEFINFAYNESDTKKIRMY